ncbi:MAG: hypothetical protein RSF40_11665, partial [Oscillospiraceae bacterium]
LFYFGANLFFTNFVFRKPSRRKLAKNNEFLCVQIRVTFEKLELQSVNIQSLDSDIRFLVAPQKTLKALVNIEVYEGFFYVGTRMEPQSSYSSNTLQPKVSM